MRDRFGIRQVVPVGDRGRITQARIDPDLAPAGLHWITALRVDAIRKLVCGGAIGPGRLEPSRMARIRSPDFPGERLILCFNPRLAEERRRRRDALLAATEDAAHGLAEGYKAGSLDRDQLNRGLGALRRRKMARHFRFAESDAAFSFQRDTETIAAEACLYGLYVIRTNLDEEQLDDAGAVPSYQALARVEQAFRSQQTLSLRVRSIFHGCDGRVRTDFFLCMPAWYLEWRMCQSLKPLMFAEQNPHTHDNSDGSASRSEKARRKQSTRRNRDGFPVHGLRDLLERLGTLCATEIDTGSGFAASEFTQPTPLQERAFALLGLKPHPAPPPRKPEPMSGDPVQ